MRANTLLALWVIQRGPSSSAGAEAFLHCQQGWEPARDSWDMKMANCAGLLSATTQVTALPPAKLKGFLNPPNQSKNYLILLWVKGKIQPCSSFSVTFCKPAAPAQAVPRVPFSLITSGRDSG